MITSIHKTLRSRLGVGLVVLAAVTALAAVALIGTGSGFHGSARAQAGHGSTEAIRSDAGAAAGAPNDAPTPETPVVGAATALPSLWPQIPNYIHNATDDNAKSGLNLSLKDIKESFGAEPEPEPVGSERLDVVFVADFSGPSKRVGQDLAKGFEDALAERKGSEVLRVLVRDDQGRAEAVEALAEGSASGFSTLALVGPTQPAGFQAFAVAAEQGQVPALIPVPPPVRIFDSTWLFSLQPGQVRQGEFAGKLLQRIRTPKKSPSSVPLKTKSAATGTAWLKVSPNQKAPNSN